MITNDLQNTGGQNAKIQPLILILCALLVTGFVGDVLSHERAGSQVFINRNLRAVFQLISLSILAFYFITSFRIKNKFANEIAILWFLPYLYMSLIALFRGQLVDSSAEMARYTILFFSFYAGASIGKIRLMQPLFFVAFLIVNIGIVLYFFGSGFVNLNSAQRATGALASPMGFAMFASIVAIGLCVIQKRMSPIIFLLVFGCLVALVLTAARSILVLTLIFITIILFARKIKKTTQIAVVFTLSILIYVSYQLGFLDRFGLSGLSDSSSTFRSTIFSVVTSETDLGVVIFGVGLGGFSEWFLDRTAISGVAPHAEIFKYIIEAGYLGSALKLACSMIAFHSIIKNTKGTPYSISVICILFFSFDVIYQFANPGYFYFSGAILLALLGAYCGEVGSSNAGRVVLVPPSSRIVRASVNPR